MLYDEQEGPVMESYIYSLDLSKDQLAVVPIAKEYSDVFEEVSGLPPY